MTGNGDIAAENEIVLEATRHQLEHFRGADPRCRVMQLPEGIMLRYTLSHALFFYLRTGSTDGKIVTRVYASDSPYDPRKNSIGEVFTPMFELDAEAQHLRKLEQLLRTWVNFVKEDPDPGEQFTVFPLTEQRD